MNDFEFDIAIDRHGSNSIKWERQTRACGMEGLDPYWIADSDWAAPSCITQAIQKRAAHPIYGYTYPSQTYFQNVCSWFQRRYKWSIQPQWILPGVGIMTSMALVLEELTNETDRIAVLTPVYDSFFTPVRGLNRELVSIPLKETNLRYEIDFEALEQEFKQGIKVLLFCNPHNPVGRVWKKPELEALVSLCCKYDVYILSDDSHCDLTAEGHQYVPIASLPSGGERTVTFTAPSKTFNVAGIGASNTIIQNEALRNRVSSCFMARLLRGTNLFAYVVCESGYGEGEAWLTRQMEYIAQNVSYLELRLQKDVPNVRITPWEGTFLLWVDFRNFGMTSKEIAAYLTKEYGIALGKGDSYGASGEGFLRINIACPRKRLESLCDKLSQFYKEQRRQNATTSPFIL